MTAATFDVDRLVELGRVSQIAPSPCGRYVAVEVARLDARHQSKYISDLWRISAVEPDARPLQLTWGGQSDRSPRYRADGALLFLSARARPESDDDEGPLPQVWMLPPEGGEPRPLTDEPTGVEAFAVGGERLAVVTRVWPGVEHDAQRTHHRERTKRGPSARRYTRMPVRFWDHWLSMAPPHLVVHHDDARRDLTPGADRQHRQPVWALSADGGTLLLSSEHLHPDRLPDSTLQVYDLASGVRHDVPLDPRETLQSLAVSADGRWAVGEVFARSDAEMGRNRLFRFDLDAIRSGGDPQRAELAGGWDVMPSLAAIDGDRVLVTAGIAGHTAVFSVGLHTGGVQRLSATDAGGAHAMPRAIGDTGAVLAIRSRLDQPPEVCRLEAGPEQPPTLLARLSGFDPAKSPKITVGALWTTSTDGARVHSLIVRPAGANGPQPTLLWIHGGPVGQHEDGWHWRWNAYTAAAAGYTVVLPNPRGSTGYGQAFVEGVWGNNWGSQVYEDILAVADDLAADPGIDSGRVAAMGASFGGYMVNWLGGHTDRFRCIVSHAGVWRMSTFHSNSDVPAWFALSAGVDPIADPEAFDRYSPHRFVKQWKSPTLVIHGEKDYRVPISQALMLFEDLDRHGVEAELLVFPDENHWILKPRNAQAWYQAALEFVGRHLDG